MNLPPSPPRTCPLCGGVYGQAAFFDAEAHSCIAPVVGWSSVSAEVLYENGRRLRVEVPVTKTDSVRTLVQHLTVALRKAEADHGNEGSGGPYR
jgi:hypothetical protein